MKRRGSKHRVSAHLPSLILCSAAVLIFSGFESPVQKAAPLSDVYRNFRNPPSAYSMIPLIRTNDTVKREEIRWQFEQLKQQGIHGAYLYPEWLGPSYGWKDAGLPYEYLSPEYFEMARVFAEEAKKAGVDLWLYDELDWPSGNAGGKIPEVPEFRSRVLDPVTHLYRGPRSVTLDLKPKTEIAAVAAYRTIGGALDPGSVKNVSGLVSGGRLAWDVPEGDWEIAVYYLETNKGFFWPYDADLLNARAVKSFLELTHHQYVEKVEKPVGAKFLGTFTDEPHIASFRNYSRKHFGADYDSFFQYLPWTVDLPETFRKMKAYDLMERLPLLHRNGGPETAKVRCDFWHVVATMFEQNYFGQIAKFNHEAGWKSTGHLNGEESLWWHLIFDGGSMFGNFRQMDYPGLDWILPYEFTSSWGVGWLAPFAGKFVSSAAHVYGKPRVMAEMFAGSGYGLNLQEIRRMVDWAHVLGVNMVVPISYKYSLRGADRATAFPPGISYQQPWWREFRPLGDYISRLGYLLSEGRFRSDVAVLLPVTEVWANYRDREYIENLTVKVHRLTDALLRKGYDLDFLDDDSLQKAATRDGRLRIGDNEYKVLILPPMSVISSRSFQRALEFHRAGGTVIAIDRLPLGSMERGDPDQQIAKAVDSVFGKNPAAGGAAGLGQLVYLDESASQLIAAVTAHVEPPLAPGAGSDGVYMQRRTIGAADFFFLVNTAGELREFEAFTRISGVPEIWDAETGRRWSLVPAQDPMDGTRLRLKMEPYGSFFLVFNSGLPRAPRLKSWRNPVGKLELTGQWQFSLEPTMTEPHVAWNFFPVPEGWKSKETNYSAIKQIELGDWRDRGLPYYSGWATYEKTFELATVEENREYVLDLGKVGVAARVTLNGKSLGSRLWKPYRFEITSALRRGTNTLRISITNTLANYFSQFDHLKDGPLYRGGVLPWMLPSGLMGPVTMYAYAE